MELLYFILGIFFISYVIPIIDGITNWILTWIKVQKTKQNDIGNQLTIKINKDTVSAEKLISKNTIGFQYLDAEEGEDEEDEV